MIIHQLKNKFYNLRNNSKNIRKPHEIIIFTDGYSFSATSFLIKQTQFRKGAIIVGYGGNPENNIFDSGQSPSAVKITNDDPDLIEQKIENCGYTLYYTYSESFKYHKIFPN